MPFGDGTGPAGQGPMTGRGAGYCAGYSSPGSMNGVPGRGYYGRGGGFYGRSRGFRNMYYATGLPGWVRSRQYAGTDAFVNNEKEALQQQEKYLKEELNNIQQRMDLLKKEENKTKE